MQSFFIKTILIFILVIHAFGDHNSTKQEDLKEKVLFQGKEYYEKKLQEKEPAKKGKDIKVYKKSDGSIDTFKTYRYNQE